MTKQVYCFYATLKGQRPKGVDASPQWHSNINLATDLLEKKITRRTTLKFESISINESLQSLRTRARHLVIGTSLFADTNNIY
jgi:hypothetical protein